MTRRKLVAGNWKMNGVAAELTEVTSIAAAARGIAGVDVALCVPATLIDRAAREASGFPIGGQDVHQAESGAFTGCVSAAMLLDAGAVLTIVGHSERREMQNESNADVRAKAEAALAADLGVILCVGENEEQRESGRAIETVMAQLESSLPKIIPAAERIAIAYEPIWAIGTGKTAQPKDIGDMHAALRSCLRSVYGDAGAKVRILYGGSVKGANASEIFGISDVDGALVGGASLKAADFLPIVAAAAECSKS